MASDSFDSVRFADVLSEPVRNGLYKAKEFHGRGTKVVNMGELFANSRLGGVPMRRIELTEKEMNKFLLQPGDLLFARRSLVAEGAGRCTLVTEVPERTVFESSIIRARPNPQKADSRYLHYFFASPQGRELMRGILRQVAVAGITGSDLSELQVSMPKLPVQGRIAETLSSIDDRIDNLRQSNTTLEAIAQALFKSWFVDFDPVRAKAEGRVPNGMDAATAALFPSEFEDSELGPIPKGWRVDGLGEVSQNTREQAKPEGLNPNTPYIGLEHMPRKSIALTDHGIAEGLASGKFWYRTNDILFGKLRPYFHKVGVAVGDGVCSTDILVVRPISPRWFGYTAMQFSSDAVVAYATQLSNGAKMPRTNWGDLAKYRVALPPDDIAEAFDNIVRPMIARIHANIASARTITQLRDTLLPRLISGKLRLPEPASADMAA